ncbi:hypothetical protein GCM10025331_03180 [Actinoplanes utahensis]|nr:hypothetical protein Aut01nite_10450 [Actinoplanes utahensis]
MAQLANDLQISDQTIYVWRRQVAIDSGLLPGVTSTESAELSQARRRIAELEAELEFHRKAAELLKEAVPPKDRFAAIKPWPLKDYPSACAAGYWTCRSPATTPGSTGPRQHGRCATPGSPKGSAPFTKPLAEPTARCESTPSSGSAAWPAGREDSRIFDWRYHLVRYPDMRSGTTGIYFGIDGALGYTMCMLRTKRLSGYYRDPVLPQVWESSGTDERVEDPWFSGYETIPGGCGRSATVSACGASTAASPSTYPTTRSSAANSPRSSNGTGW